MSMSLSGPGALMEDPRCELRRVTPRDGHYFFGYYEKTPWDSTGRYLLATRSSFMDRRPTLDDEAIVGLIDLEAGNSFRPLATTRAWNWQQGAMAQWLADGKVLFNDRRDGRFVAVILDPANGQERVLPRPIYAVDPAGKAGVSLSFARLFTVRPGYGYAGVADPYEADAAPKGDGLWQVDMVSGEDKLLVSLAELAQNDPWLHVPEAKHWVNHVQFCREGGRFAFFHRWRTAPQLQRKRNRQTRLMTAELDRVNFTCLSDHEMASHYDWTPDGQLIAWARRNEIGDRYFRFTDGSSEPQVIGENVFTGDGHCSISPDGRFMLTDTYADEAGRRPLMTWDLHQEILHPIGRFFGPYPADVEIRCDLHPRWNRDGTQVCIDSYHEGERAMYTVDVQAITRG